MLSACRENDERNRGRQIILRLNPPVLPHALNPAAVVGNSAELIACLTVARAGDVGGASRAERPEWPAGIERTNLRPLFLGALYPIRWRYITFALIWPTRLDICAPIALRGLNQLAVRRIEGNRAGPLILFTR
jgi:hypothetical protein